MDISGLCRRIGEIRAIGKSDAEKAHLLEDRLLVDVLRAIADKDVQGDPAGFAVIALETQNIEFDRWMS